MPYKKLLVGVDFTAQSHEALRAAADIARADHSELVILHVSPLLAPSFACPELPIVVDEDAACEVALAEWRREAAHLGASHIRTELAFGTPWQEIVEMLVREGSFDLAVIGTHGHGGLWRMLFGSSSEQIVKNSPCPVMVVRTN